MLICVDNASTSAYNSDLSKLSCAGGAKHASLIRGLIRERLVVQAPICTHFSDHRRGHTRSRTEDRSDVL